MDATALVIFTDIRGFTVWARDTEVFARLNEFVRSYMALVRKHFPAPTFVKGLGDGAMIVREISAATSAKAYAELLEGTLKQIQAAEQEFDGLCQSFAQKVGQKTELRLGWGIVRGPVKKFKKDYVGPNVNKAARLCDAARPFGIVIDASDFTDKPQFAPFRFFEQTRKLSGAGDVETWVTPEVFNNFVAREKLRQTPEVHVAGMCIDPASARGIKLLVARRSSTRSMFRDKLEGCGGQLARSEMFMDGVRRHFRLELGLEVRVLKDIYCFYEIILPDEPLIPGIRFLCEVVGEPPPEISSPNHSDVRWYSESEFNRTPADEFVGNLKDEVADLLSRYKKAHT